MLIFLAILAVIAAGFSGLVFAAARSDFLFRRCHEMARSDWWATANCADALFAQVMFGGLSFGLLSLASFLFYRRFAG